MKKRFIDNAQRLVWEDEATKVIKDKIEHFKSTGNSRKLAIYEAKLGQKAKLIETIKGLIKKQQEDLNKSN